MKSFSSSSAQAEKELQEIPVRHLHGNVTALYQLFEKVNELEGSIVNCGIATEECFNSFALLRNMKKPKKLIAFEKHTRSLYFENEPLPHGTLSYKTQTVPLNTGFMQLNLLKQNIRLDNEFVPGYISDSIPNYLIENPELKISFLTILLDDYDATMTALEFFFPRLIDGGILVLESFYKKEDDYRAVCDYFAYDKMGTVILENNGLHYLVIK